MCHGGEEYHPEVSPAQRHWARWLVARGASVVAGAPPHVVQRSEFHRGARVFHSLGNAVYPKALKGADSGKVETVEIP
jgi:poly-gamma-glutamate capsule biosynthesis protein CapA/YwtB (metallophosphatase superfamily)